MIRDDAGVEQKGRDGCNDDCVISGTPLFTHSFAIPGSEGQYWTSIALDEQGNIYVTGPDGVWVFAPDGEHLGVIQVPESVGNVNCGDDDWKSLYIPASTSVYRVRLKVGGNRLGYMH